MSISKEHRELALTIIVTVVGGKRCVRRCLSTLCPQVDFADTEIIVPYDSWSIDIGDLFEEFPKVTFHFTPDINSASVVTKTYPKHYLYDRRRSRGLLLARGRLIAMTEDYAVPAENWCKQIISVHEQPYAVIGGAIENAVDRPLNWALYYCDFGRYGRPLAARDTEYASDVNVTYKYEALAAIRDVWQTAYHETTVNWTLHSRGETVFFDPSLVVFQHRPTITLGKAMRERLEWGRVFAETRVAACRTWQRVSYAGGTVILPALLLVRVLRHMFRQRRRPWLIIQTLPHTFCLLLAWALGEFTGYCRAQPETSSVAQKAPKFIRER